MTHRDIILQHVKDNMPTYTACVRDLYDNPEIGNQEFRSMGKLCERLRDAGFDVTE